MFLTTHSPLKTAGRPTRLTLVRTSLNLLLAALGLMLPSAGAVDQPNLLVFLMDDMGYGDARVYNPDSQIVLPNIERLAEQGMVFLDAHSPSTVCAPTRYSLLSGNYPWRGRNFFGTWTFFRRSQILPGQRLLPALLGEAGYRSYFLGKLHLGGTVRLNNGGALDSPDYDYREIDFTRPIEQGPLAQGFDFSYWLPSGIQAPPYAFYEQDRIATDPAALTFWNEGDYGHTVIPRPGFGAPDWDTSAVGPRLTAKALNYLEHHFQQSPDQPFFLYYSSQSCHTPHTPPESLMGQRVAGASGADRHLDLIVEADITLGLIMDKLAALGQLNDTLILFTSDNGGLNWGGPDAFGHDSNGPLRGGKAQIWEGGHRVPLIAHWPKGPLQQGRRSQALVGLQDIYATLAEVAGIAVPEDQAIDSRSFLPTLSGQDPLGRATLFVQGHNDDSNGQRGAMMWREGPWKLIISQRLLPTHLFNLEEDLGETRNLIDDPEQAARIRSMRRAAVRLLAESKRYSGAEE